MTDTYSTITTLLACLVTTLVITTFIARLTRCIGERTACGLYALASVVAAIHGYLAHAWPWNLAAGLSAIVIVISYLTLPRREKEPQQ